jgi:putative membrane protein
MLLTATALLAACGSPDNDTTPAATDSASTDLPMETPAPTALPGASTSAADYVAKAGAGDMWEIESSKALLANSKRDDVKAFAQMMIDNHGKSTAKVKAAAGAASIDIAPPKLAPDQQRMLDEIKKADAAAIDAVFLRHQKTAHDAALALHRAYATNGDTESLKKAASEIAPVVEAHIAELQKLDKVEPAGDR